MHDFKIGILNRVVLYDHRHRECPIKRIKLDPNFHKFLSYILRRAQKQREYDCKVEDEVLFKISPLSFKNILVHGN